MLKSESITALAKAAYEAHGRTYGLAWEQLTDDTQDAWRLSALRIVGMIADNPALIEDEPPPLTPEDVPLKALDGAHIIRRGKVVWDKDRFPQLSDPPPPSVDPDDDDTLPLDAPTSLSDVGRMMRWNLR